jgi:hypothetical protein
MFFGDMASIMPNDGMILDGKDVEGSERGLW